MYDCRLWLARGTGGIYTTTKGIGTACAIQLVSLGLEWALVLHGDGATRIREDTAVHVWCT